MEDERLQGRFERSPLASASVGAGFDVISAITPRRFSPPWSVQRFSSGFKVIDASGQAFAYFYAHDNDHDANTGRADHGRGKAVGEQLRQAARAARPRLGVC